MQLSSSACLAALIDEHARTDAPPVKPGRDPAVPSSPVDCNVLIWVEDAVAGPGLPARHNRGMVVVAHGPGQAVAERSFVISCPVEASGEGRQVPAVLSLLQAMGWSLLASRHRTTATGHANTAVLVNKTCSGGERRLWLAEPALTPQAQGRARKNMRSNPMPCRAAAKSATSKARRQAAGWSDEGSAGGDVAA